MQRREYQSHTDFDLPKFHGSRDARHRDQESNPNGDVHRDPDRDAYPYPNTNSHSHPYAKFYPYGDADGNSDSDANPGPHTLGGRP